MTSLDERLTRTGAEVADSLASAPIGEPSGVVRRAARRRAMTSGAALVAVALMVVAGLGLLDRGDRTQQLEAGSASGEAGTTATTVGGDSRVAALADVPALALHDSGWKLYESRETSGDTAHGAGAVPSRHVRYINDSVPGAVVSLSLFGVPPGSFYETMVPLLVATDSFSPVRIRGTQGRVATGDGRMFSFAWRESDTTIAALSVSGVADRQAAVAIAETFRPVGAAEWKNMLLQPPPPDAVTKTTLGG